MYAAMFDELTKIAEDEVERSEAIGAIKRLRELEAKKPTGAQLARGALTGAMVGPAAALAGRAVSGQLGKGIREGVGTAMQAPTKGGKALGLAKALGGGIRSLGGAAASGAVFGAALPTVRGHLESESEKETLRQYLGGGEKGLVRRKMKRTLGV